MTGRKRRRNSERAVQAAKTPTAVNLTMCSWRMSGQGRARGRPALTEKHQGRDTERAAEPKTPVNPEMWWWMRSETRGVKERPALTQGLPTRETGLAAKQELPPTPALVERRPG